ncbi:MAG: ParB/RepB/Spo0J family partition protein [Methylocystis sp.]
MMATVRFDALIPGEKINARSTGRSEGIDSLAASILAKGIIEPLAVRVSSADDQKAEIIDGNRRWAALKKLVDASSIPAHYSVPVHYRPEDADDFDARESSLVANIERLPLHPIDQFEEFSRLSERYTPEEIAARYGITERLVRQRVALGGLHPDIREAWRAGKLRDDSAHAFTLATDQKQQLKIFKKLEKQHNLWSHNIKAELGVNHDAAKALKIIGAEAYRAAGGHLVEDLFGDDCVVSDPKLAQKLLAERLQSECDALIAEGWSFAVLREGVKESWNWPRLKPSGKATATDEENARLAEIDKERDEINARGESEDGLSNEDEARLDELDIERERIEQAIDLRRWGVKQKKTAGCFVEVDHRGAVSIAYGVQNPKDAKKAAKEKARKADAEDDAAGDEKPTISASLGLRLSEQLTIAAANAVARWPQLALCAVVATLDQTYATGPLKLSAQGYSALRAEDNDDLSFEDALAVLLAKPTESVLERLAEAIKPAFDMRNYTGGAPRPEFDALVAAIDNQTFLREARAVFDADAYFKAVKADLCHVALDEMGVQPKGRPKKKSELAALCVERAKAQGWLPPQMRKPEALVDPDKSVETP